MRVGFESFEKKKKSLLTNLMRFLYEIFIPPWEFINRLTIDLISVFHKLFEELNDKICADEKKEFPENIRRKLNKELSGIFKIIMKIIE